MSDSKRGRGRRVGVAAVSDSGSGSEAGVGDGEGEVGRLVDCSQADDRRMIRLVRERRLLYARNNMPVASYYSQVKRLWQEVANEMEWTVADVRRKWSHIRNSYSRHLRNEMYGVRTGRGRMVSKWYLADELQFLREHMATDTRPSRYSYSTPMFVDMKPPPPAEAPEHLELKPLIPSPWFLAGAPAPPAACASPSPARDDSCSAHSFEHDENSAYFQFFRGIYNDYQELPATKQRLFRRECLTFLHRLLDEEGDCTQVPAEHGCEQDGAMNLSHDADDEEREQKPSVAELDTKFRHFSN